MIGYLRRPEWLKLNPINFDTLDGMRRLIRDLGLHTVCDSAQCPNRIECFRQNVATFMILGDICTRSCAFCAIKNGQPLRLNPHEPDNICKAIKKMNLNYVVITSVTRDDLTDGGAFHFAECIKTIHRLDPEILVEVLIPDFNGSLSSLKAVSEASPVIINHNIETVPRLYSEVRPQANYNLSLRVLKTAKTLIKNILTKSGMMVGLGESHREVVGVMEDLRKVGCDILTIGQYLQPSSRNYPVSYYVTREEFEDYNRIGKEMGFYQVVSGPLVRSSFHALQAYNSAQKLARPTLG